MKRSLSVVVLLLFDTLAALAGEPRGSLFIIGGGRRPPEMMQEFLALAGGPGAARIMVVPLASAVPDTTGMEQAEQFRLLGAAAADFMVPTRAEAMDGSASRRLDGITGVFFSGGVQSRLTAVLGGTPLLEEIRALYYGGAAIGGTSAGAAVMSKVMISGDERLNADTVNAFLSLKKGNIVTVEGFGFIDNAIVDQHFVRRKRHNRLISLVLENPRLLGIGIDEATALVVEHGNRCRVVGEGTVIVYDAREASGVRADGRGTLSGTGVRMHVLAEGDRFDLSTGKPESAKGTE